MIEQIIFCIQSIPGFIFNNDSDFSLGFYFMAVTIKVLHGFKIRDLKKSLMG
jgi:hypothetical protein